MDDVVSHMLLGPIDGVAGIADFVDPRQMQLQQQLQVSAAIAAAAAAAAAVTACI
jgi:hypothetical protein